jgi:hypothetical protein
VLGPAQRDALLPRLEDEARFLARLELVAHGAGRDLRCVPMAEIPGLEVASDEPETQLLKLELSLGQDRGSLRR